MKKLLLSLAVLGASAAVVQAQNHVLLADTAFTTTIANGNKVSQLSAPLGNNYGMSMSTVSGFYMAEDFTVPAGQTWTVDTLIVYGYQTGSSTTSSFTAATLEVFQGSVTGTSVFGDDFTNRMAGTGFTGIYRTTETDTTNTQRPIMEVKIALVPAQTFTAGTYWAVWSASGSLASGPWCPPKVLPGKINPPNQNGMQFTGSWVQAKDSTAAGVQDLGFNMILKGTPPCNPVVVNLGNDTAICAGASLALDAGVVGSAYLWSNGATTQSISVTTAGSYWVEVTDVSGCSGRDTLHVTVNPLPVVNLGGNSTICSGTSRMLDAGNAGAAYLWSTGATTQTINATTTGTYKVTVTNANGCAGKDSVVLTVDPAPMVNLGRDTAICSGNILSLDAANTGATYQWSTGATSQSISVNAAGAYSVVVTSANGCMGRDTINVAVNPLPVAGTIAVSGQSPTFTFTISGNQNGPSGGWHFGDGTVDTASAPTTATHTYSANGTYTVKFYAANACGKDSVTTVVMVNNASVKTIDLDGTVALFPNPASGWVTIRNTAGVPMQKIIIFNTTGAVVRQEAATGAPEQRLDISGLAAGIYQVRIELDGATLVRKLQIGD